MEILVNCMFISLAGGILIGIMMKDIRTFMAMFVMMFVSMTGMFWIIEMTS